MRVEGLLALREAELAKERTKTMEFRTQELESFIYILTHDMKTPVVNLQGLVGLLEQDHAPSLPPEAVEYLNRLRRNADRLEELLRDLLEYPRRLSLLGPLETVPSAPIVSAAMDGLQEMIRARNVAVSVASDPPPVAGDRKTLQHVLHNWREHP